PLAFADVEVVEDAQQPRADAKFLQIETAAAADGAQIRLLHQILSLARIARELAGHPVQQIQLLQGQRFELFASQLHEKLSMLRRDTISAQARKSKRGGGREWRCSRSGRSRAALPPEGRRKGAGRLPTLPQHFPLHTA